MITDSRYKKKINVPFISQHTPENFRPNAADNNALRFDQLVHDLKSPVNSIKGIIKLANIQVTDEQAKEFFFMLNECVDKLEDKITHTLDMFERGTDLTEVELLNFQDILYETMISLGHIDGFEEISFSTDISNKQPFYSSKPLVESVIQNLLENAIKYRCRDKNRLCKIKIDIRDSNTGIRIQVSDNGIGIEENILPQIFEPNFKSAISQDSHGLGLFIVKRAVEKMNGTIETTSTPNSGTSFVVNIPNVQL